MDNTLDLDTTLFFNSWFRPNKYIDWNNYSLSCGPITPCYCITTCFSANLVLQLQAQNYIAYSQLQEAIHSPIQT